MFISSCPLRVSLFGGSTDSPAFIDTYGVGMVINLSINLNTYVTLTQDAHFGYNQHGKKYVINYSKREEVSTIPSIQNQLVREVLDYFKAPPICVSLTSDVYAQGSGLASSSSYLISLIKAVTMFMEIRMTDIEISALAIKLEQRVNPYCGYQDPYGCGVAGFTRITFKKDSISYEFLPTGIFNELDAHLIFTGITRNSLPILESVSNNLTKSFLLTEYVNWAYDALIEGNVSEFLNLLGESWRIKKDTSPMILGDSKLKTMDAALYENDSVLAHKLCGAGNGGFFLTFSKPNTLDIPYESVKVNLSQRGISGEKYGLL